MKLYELLHVLGMDNRVKIENTDEVYSNVLNANRHIPTPCLNRVVVYVGVSDDGCISIVLD